MAKADTEKLDSPNIERVIAYLAEKGSTKKTACQMLGISYNTTRLDKLIESHKTKKAKDAERRAEKRGKPATKEELSFIIVEYLEGRSIAEISRNIYRGTTFINNVLDEYGVPKRESGNNYFRPAIIPEASVADSLKEGELVYSAKYDCLAKIVKEVPCKSGKAYSIYLNSERYKEFAYQPVWELASLQHIREKGIDI